MSRWMSSSPVNSEEDISLSPNREVSSPVHQNGSVNSSKSSKLSFSIFRLLGANRGQSKQSASGATSEGESESPSSLCSHCPSTDNMGTVMSYPSPSSPESKRQSQRAAISPYNQSTAPNIRMQGERPPTLAFAPHHPWMGPTTQIPGRNGSPERATFGNPSLQSSPFYSNQYYNQIYWRLFEERLIQTNPYLLQICGKSQTMLYLLISLHFDKEISKFVSLEIERKQKKFCKRIHSRL